jgi:hypothetical protein
MATSAAGIGTTPVTTTRPAGPGHDRAGAAVRMRLDRRRRPAAHRACWVWALLAGAAAGCGGSGGGPPLGTVSGVVTLDGQPLADATVTFTPAAGRPSQGFTGSDGRYTLAYTVEQPGAMVGDHVVRISTEGYVERPGGAVEQMKERVPATYNAQSTLTATVKAGTNDLPFELQSK